MQVSVETTDGLERRMTVAIPAERVDKEVNNRLKKMANTVRIDGFRPGKVPVKVVANKYGQRVREEVLNEVKQSTVYEAITQEKLQPAGQPLIEQQVSESDNNIEITAIFEVFPEVELAPLDAIKIDKPVAEVTEVDVDNMFEKMRKQRAEWKAVERPAKIDDQLIIDFTGTINGENFEGNEGKQVPLVLGSRSFIEGFEEKLVGVSQGDEIVLDLKFPENYQVAHLANKPVQFIVKVHQVSEAQLPEINEDFFRLFGITEGGLDSFRAETRKSMEFELNDAIMNQLRKQVMDALYEANKDTDVPKAMVEKEIQHLMTQAQATLAQQGAADVELDRAVFEDQAKRRAVLALLIAEVVKQYEITVSQEELKAKVESIAAVYDDPQQVVNWYMGDQQRLSNVESLVLEERVVDKVMEMASVTENRTSFDEIMSGRQA